MGSPALARSGPAVRPARLPVPLQRARGELRISTKARGDHSVLDDLYQSGSFKCLFPRTPDKMPQAVIINIAGGITGGDRLRTQCTAKKGADLLVTTQAAERIYRSLGDNAIVENRLVLEAGARLHWLPQETILFEGARLARRLEIEMATDATLIAIEPLILGRKAMGERLESGFFSDIWRVHRGGRLIHADALRLAAPFRPILESAAGWGGMIAQATILYVAPDAEAALPKLRALLADMTAKEGGFEAGVSAWNGLLTVRCLARDGAALRALMIPLLTYLRGVPMPPVWRL